MKTIEQLQYQANSVKSELEALKRLAESTKEEKELKEKKTKNLTDQIASITLELNNRILVLKDKTDTSSLEELKKAEEVLKILDDSSSELTNLQKNVVDQLSAGISDVKDKTTDMAEKVGDTMGVRDKDSKKMNWGKTAAWVGGAIGATWLFSTVKGWFSGNDKKESEEKKEEGFFNHGIGKGIKYAAIGVAGFFGIKWLLDYFNKDKSGRDPENTEKPSDAINVSWEKLQQENPERAKQATDISTQVNDCRSKQILQNINGRLENDMLGESSSTSDFIFDKAPGAVIAHMDTQYNSVADMLDKDDYVMNTIQSSLNKPYYAVMERGEEKITNVLKPLAGIVTGILPGHRGSDGKLTAEGKAELAKVNPERDQQLHNIFAKYMRVKLWYNLKIQQLREKLAKDELGPNATAGDIEDYLDDDVKRKVIDAKIESQFLNLKLIDAAQFLTQQGIPNDMLPENMKEVITDINDEYRKYHTIEIEKVLQKNENPSTHKEGLTKSCNEFIAHLTEPAVSRNMATGLWHTLGVDIRANNTGADIDAIAKQMGFDQIVSGYQKDVTDLSLKITNGTATKEDIQHLHDLMESFRMLQIEITLGGIVKNESDGQGGFVDKVVTRFGEWTMGIVKDEEGNWNWKTIAFAGGIYLLRKPLGFVVKPVAKASWSTLKFVGRTPMMSGALRGLANRIPTGSYMRSLKYRGDVGKNRLVKDIANRKISLEQAEHVYKRVRGDISQSKSFSELIHSEFGGKTVAQLESELKAGKNISPKTSKIEVLKKDIDTLAKDIEKSTHHVSAETKKIFSTFEREVMDAAKKANIKKGTPAYTALSKKIWASANYGKNPKLLELISQHNTAIAKNETNIMKLFNKSSRSEKQKLYSNPVIKSIVDTNGGLEKWKLPGGKGRIISIGLHAVMLGWMGSQDNTDGSKKTLKETSLDVADFGISMVPVAGGIYDMGVAIQGTDLNGNELSTSERRIRGTIGGVSVVLDCFSFGTGGALLKGAVKGGEKIILKEGTEMIVKEGTEIAVEGGIKTFAKKTLKSAGRDILLGTTAGIVLMPVMGKLQQVSLDDDTKVIPIQKPIITKQAA